MLVMLYECNSAGHYSGYVGDGSWVFDPRDVVTHFCWACGDPVRIAYSDRGAVRPNFVLEEASPLQVDDLLRAANDLPRELGRRD